MKHHISIDMVKPQDFFNSINTNYDELLKITHEKTEYESFDVYDFNTTDLKYVKIVKFKKDVELVSKLPEMDSIDIDDKLHFMHLYNVKKDQFCFVGEHQSYVMDIIRELNKYSPIKAKKLLTEYSNYVIGKASEVLLFENNLKDEQNKMYSALVENKIIQLKHNVPFDKEMSDDEQDSWFAKIATDSKDKISLPGYCDLDFYPFIYNGLMMIRDVASGGTLLICDRVDDNNFAWYKAEGCFSDYGDLQDLYYESNHYLQESIDNELVEINKVVEYKDGKIVFATGDIHYVDLIQKTVFEGMVEDGYITKDTHNLSFRELLKNYTAQHGGYMLEQRCIKGLLEDLCVINNELTYEDFRLMDKETINDLVKQDNTLYLSMIKNIEIGAELEYKHIEEIHDYLDELNMLYKKEKDVEEAIAILKKDVGSCLKTSKLKP